MIPTFLHPAVLWLLLPLAAVVIWRWVATPPGIAVSSNEHFNPRRSRRFFAPRHWLLFLEALAAVSFVVALARPQLDIEIVPVRREGIDIMIVLDYSNSMDAFDPGPNIPQSEIEDRIADGTLIDRLAVAREQISRFVKRRSGDRIGLVIFGHDAYVACPPTLDHNFLVSQVEQLTNSLLTSHERGTNIASGIVAALNTLLDHGEKRRAMVLITDGENSIDDEIFTPIEAAEAASDKKVTIHTVGIGSDNMYSRRRLNRRQSFDTEALERIAEASGGRFFRAKDNVGFEQVMDTIDALETTSRVHPAIVYHRDLFPPIIIVGTAALLLSFLFKHTILQELS